MLHRESIYVSIIDLGTFNQFEYLQSSCKHQTALSQITSSIDKWGQFPALSTTNCPIYLASCHKVVNARSSAVISTVLAKMAFCSMIVFRKCCLVTASYSW